MFYQVCLHFLQILNAILKLPKINIEFGVRGPMFIPTWIGEHLGHATYRETNINEVHEAYMLVGSPLAARSLRLVHLDLVWQQLAAAADMGEDFLFQLGHLLPQQAGRRGQVGVLALERLDLVL